MSLVQLHGFPFGLPQSSLYQDARLFPDDLMAALVRVEETEDEHRAHVGHHAVERPPARDAPVTLPERLLALRVQSEMVEASAPEHRLRARWLNAGYLTRVQDCVRSHLDKGVAATIFFQVHRDSCPKDALVEGDEAIHVGGDERQVVDVVEQWRRRLPLLYLLEFGHLLFTHLFAPSDPASSWASRPKRVSISGRRSSCRIIPWRSPGSASAFRVRSARRAFWNSCMTIRYSLMPYNFDLPCLCSIVCSSTSIRTDALCVRPRRIPLHADLRSSLMYFTPNQAVA